MNVHVFPSGPFATNAYVVVCLRAQVAALIDPAPDSAQVLEAYLRERNLKPEKILLTHSHWDHIADVASLQTRFSIPVYVHALDAGNLAKPGSDKVPCWIEIPPVTKYETLKEDDQISVGDLIFDVMHTPGHTPGGVCFYCRENGYLLSGDTLFKGTFGNVTLPTSNSKEMWKSLKKLSKLPANTVVFPGHGPQTTIGSEHWLAEAETLFGGR